VSEVSQTSKESEMKAEVVLRLLNLNLPARLSRRPSPDTLVLSDLMLERGQEDHRRDALHPVRLVEGGVDLVDVLVVTLKLALGVGSIRVPELVNTLLEVEERSGVRFALKSGLSGEATVDARDHSFDSGDLTEGGFESGRWRSRSGMASGVLLLESRVQLVTKTNPSTDVIHEVEDGLGGRKGGKLTTKSASIDSSLHRRRRPAYLGA
jgi:hypothetical protein